jgi:hypothetical protein
LNYLRNFNPATRHVLEAENKKKSDILAARIFNYLEKKDKSIFSRVRKKFLKVKKSITDRIIFSKKKK